MCGELCVSVCDVCRMEFECAVWELSCVSVLGVCTMKCVFCMVCVCVRCVHRGECAKWCVSLRGLCTVHSVC